DRAERQVREGRWNAYLANLGKAQAARWSGQPGRRFDSLDALAQAAEVGRGLSMSEERTLELRNEVIGCLALADVRVLRQADVALTYGTCAAFDRALERYAVSDSQGTIRVCRAADDRELFQLQGPKAQGWLLQFSPNGRLLAAKHHPPSQDNAAVFVVWRLDRRE